MAVAKDVDQVKGFLPEFQYSNALAEDSVAELIRCQLKDIITQSAEDKVKIQSDISCSAEQLQQAEVALQSILEAERQQVQDLEAKVSSLIDAQVELQNVQEERKKAESANRDYILIGDELREAKMRNISVNEGVFCSLLNGSWKSEKDKEQKLSSLKDYLQEVGTEKTLVCAAEGLSIAPEGRGDFDKMAIDCITEELAEKLRQTEEKLFERAPAEKQVRAELLGLEALQDVCAEKAKAAEKAHKEVEVSVKGSKSGLKSGKQQVAKHSKELAALKQKMQAEEGKAGACQEALEAFQRLESAAKAAVEAERVARKAAAEAAEKAAAEKAAAEAAEKAAAEKAAAEAAEKAAAEKAAAEKAAAEQAAAEAAEKAAAEQAAAEAAIKAAAEKVAAETEQQDLEPPAKRLRTQEEAKLEVQVASPARVRMSIG